MNDIWNFKRNVNTVLVLHTTPLFHICRNEGIKEAKGGGNEGVKSGNEGVKGG